MAKRRFGAVICLLCFCLCFMTQYVAAASTTEAREPIVTDKDCTLTISYAFDGMPFPEQGVSLYKIADVSENFQYTLTSAFAASELILNGIQTNGEWTVIRSTLEAHILANDIEPSRTATTDELGLAYFTGLKPGLYLASAVTVPLDNGTCFFDSALIALPGLGEDGLWQYNVAVSAKPEYLPDIQPDEELQFRVVKLWKGDEGRSDRPKNVKVEIYRNGVRYETVTLSEENHWSYSWKAQDDGSSWKVIERSVPKGYTMTVEQREAVFVVTNTRIPDDPDKPKPPSETGDSMNIMLYATLMYVSGTMLIILAIVGKRKRHEETNSGFEISDFLDCWNLFACDCRNWAACMAMGHS